MIDKKHKTVSSLKSTAHVDAMANALDATGAFTVERNDESGTLVVTQIKTGQEVLRAIEKSPSQHAWIVTHVHDLFT